MKFGHPEYFLLLLLIPLMIAGAITTSRRRDAKMGLLVARRLRPLLYHPRPRNRRWLALTSFMLALCLLIIALASPSAGFRERPDTVRGRNIIIAIDVSRSMFAEDVSPNRFHAAKASALELLDRFPDDRIGIIAFSGTAWLQAPLTVDHGALRDTLQQLDYAEDRRNDWIPRDGSDLASAVRLAIKTLHKTGQRDSTLVLLSDGETHHGGVDQAGHEANREGVTIFSAGFGTARGSFIPDPLSTNGQFHDREGSLVITRLNSEPLLRLSSKTGGVYSEGAGRNFLAKLEVAIQRLERFESEGRKRRIAIPHFQWFLGPSMLLFALGMLLNSNFQLRTSARPALGNPLAGAVPPPRGASTNPGRIVLAILLSFLAIPLTEAGLLPRTPAERALSQGNHEGSLALFSDEIAKARGERKARLRLGAATAAYRLGRYQSASQFYSGALLSRSGDVQAQAHFGLGNTQYYKGLRLKQSGSSRQVVTLYWQDAVDHFEAVLALDPKNRKAKENLDYVRKKAGEWPPQKEQDAPSTPEKDTPSRVENDPGRRPENVPPETGNGDDQKSSPESREKNEQPRVNENPPEHQDPNEENRVSESGDLADGEERIKPRPGETPGEFARRILRDNADFELSPLPRKPIGSRRPKKDW